MGGSLHPVVDHLHGIVNYIHRIRESADSSVVPPRLILELEMFLTKFFFEKLRRRILKHIDTFVDQYASILSAPLAGTEPFIDMHRTRLLGLIENLRSIRNRLPLRGQVDESEILWLMERIKMIYVDWRPEEDNSLPRTMDLLGKFLSS